MNQHLRGYLLVCGYTLLPAYLITKYTVVSGYFPQFFGTRTSLVSALVLGLIIYSIILIFRYFSFNENRRWAVLLPRGVVLVVSFMELISINLSEVRVRHEGTYNYWGPYKIIWTKALIADLGENYSGWGSREQITGFFRRHPTAAKLTLGSLDYALKHHIRVSKPRVPRIREKALAVIPELTVVATRGAVLDGKFYHWGVLPDGRELSFTGDKSSVAIRQQDGTVTTLRIQVE